MKFVRKIGRALVQYWVYVASVHDNAPLYWKKTVRALAVLKDTYN